MEWVDSPGKGRNTSALLQEFEKRFDGPNMLDTSKVLLFIKTIDLLDWERVYLVLDVDSRPIGPW